MYSLQMLPWPVTGQYVSRRSSTVQLYVPFLYLKLQVAFEMHSFHRIIICFIFVREIVEHQDLTEHPVFLELWYV